MVTFTDGYFTTDSKYRKDYAKIITVRVYTYCDASLKPPDMLRSW
jgi:hypothetical protein